MQAKGKGGSPRGLKCQGKPLKGSLWEPDSGGQESPVPASPGEDSEPEGWVPGPEHAGGLPASREQAGASAGLCCPGPGSSGWYPGWGDALPFGEPACPWLDGQGWGVPPRGGSEKRGWIGWGLLAGTQDGPGRRQKGPETLVDQKPSPTALWDSAPDTHTPSLRAEGPGQTGTARCGPLTPARWPVHPPRPSQTPAP